jgi:hypothetical protein
MEEQLITYFIQETNKKLTELTTAVSKQSKDIATLMLDHHIKYTRPRTYHIEKYGIPTGIATGIVIAWQAVVMLTN